MKNEKKEKSSKGGKKMKGLRDGKVEYETRNSGKRISPPSSSTDYIFSGKKGQSKENHLLK